jgi:hypothetical protein
MPSRSPTATPGRAGAAGDRAAQQRRAISFVDYDQGLAQMESEILPRLVRAGLRAG